MSFINTNVLVYSTSVDSPFRAQARAALNRVASAGTVATSRQVLREYVPGADARPSASPPPPPRSTARRSPGTAPPAGSNTSWFSVALDNTRMIIDRQELSVVPWMAVTVEIKTGRRSVISYLLPPLQRYTHEGIRER